MMITFFKQLLKEEKSTSTISSLVKKEIDYDKQIILIVQSQSKLEHVIEELEQDGHIVVVTDNIEEAITADSHFEFDCIVLNGYDEALLHTFGSFHKQKDNYIPLIVVNNSNTQHSRMKCYSLGADDCIPYTAQTDEVILRIYRQLDRKRAIDHITSIDELTQAYNRKFLPPIYNQLIHSAPLSFALVDFDHFKAINDQYGYVTGDQVLVRLVKEFKNNLKANDVIIRMGGEEFVILFPNTDVKTAKRKLDQILKTFSTITFRHENQIFTCTFSAGVHQVTKNESGLLQNINKANKLLSKAKKHGRKQIFVANSG